MGWNEKANLVGMEVEEVGWNSRSFIEQGGEMVRVAGREEDRGSAGFACGLVFTGRRKEVVEAYKRGYGT